MIMDNLSCVREILNRQYMCRKKITINEKKYTFKTFNIANKITLDTSDITKKFQFFGSQQFFFEQQQRFRFKTISCEKKKNRTVHKCIEIVSAKIDALDRKELLPLLFLKTDVSE